MFSELKARPSRPSDFASRTKLSVTSVANSMAWLGTTAPPMLTVSTPTFPAALDLSPYEIENEAPSSGLKVWDWVGSKSV